MMQEQGAMAKNCNTESSNKYTQELLYNDSDRAL